MPLIYGPYFSMNNNNFTKMDYTYIHGSQIHVAFLCKYIFLHIQGLNKRCDRINVFGLHAKPTYNQLSFSGQHGDLKGLKLSGPINCFLPGMMDYSLHF